MRRPRQDEAPCRTRETEFDPPGFSGIKERVFGANGAVDLAAATFIEREKKGEKRLDVENAGKDASYLSLAAFIDNARGKKSPLNSVDVPTITLLRFR